MPSEHYSFGLTYGVVLLLVRDPVHVSHSHVSLVTAPAHRQPTLDAFRPAAVMPLI
jgi:hypothetical protein